MKKHTENFPNKVFTLINKHYPNAKTELTNWETPWQFLVCCILSAQTTDKRVNLVTKDLFQELEEVDDYACADIAQIEKYIKTVNYYHTKAKHLKQVANQVINLYKGKVPTNVQDLVSLAGVGYKVANVFLGEFYNISSGIAVDTHVKRVSQRLGLTKENDPYKIAKELEKQFDKSLWREINPAMVLFGRYICKSKNPLCEECYLRQECEYFNSKLVTRYACPLAGNS